MTIAPQQDAGAAMSECSKTIFIDESSTGRDGLMALGGFAMTSQDASCLAAKVEAWCSEKRMVQELKFRNICRSNADRYDEFATRLFKSILSERTRFRALVVPNKSWDMDAFDGFEGVYHRLVYQLILHCFGDLYSCGDRVTIKLDERGSNYDLDYLKMVLNRAFRLQLGGCEPIVQVEWQNSKKHRLLQAADLLTSAVGFDNNDRESLGTVAPPKLQVMRTIRQCAGVASLKTNTPKGPWPFGVWQFRFKERVPNVLGG